MLKVITFNAAILDVCVFGYNFYRPVEFIEQRLQHLAIALEQSNADIIFLQELFHRNYQDILSHALKRSYPYILGHAPRGWKLRLGNELLILSRYPLTAGQLTRFKQAPAEELRHTSKGFYHAQIEVPELGKLNLVNFHMSAGGKYKHPQSRSMEKIRHQQIKQLLALTQNLDNAIIAGDLNAGPEVSNENYQQMLSANLYDLFAESGALGMSWDPFNPLVVRGNESHLPAQRIDHIFTDNKMFKTINNVKASITFDKPCVANDKSVFPLSDHYAIEVEFSW